MEVHERIQFTHDYIVIAKSFLEQTGPRHVFLPTKSRGCYLKHSCTVFVHIVLSVGNLHVYVRCVSRSAKDLKHCCTVFVYLLLCGVNRHVYVRCRWICCE